MTSLYSVIDDQPMKIPPMPQSYLLSRSRHFLVDNLTDLRKPILKDSSRERRVLELGLAGVGHPENVCKQKGRFS